MGCSAITTRRIHDEAVRETYKVEDEVLDTLEHWCRWVCNKHVEECITSERYLRVINSE